MDGAVYGRLEAAAEWPCARPIIKWTGGKSGELASIGRALPPSPSRLIEPFLGGGAVLFAFPPTVRALVNDRSADLIDLYRRAQRLDPRLLGSAEVIAQAWEAVGALGSDTAAEGVARAAAPLVRLCPGLPQAVVREVERAVARKRRFATRLPDQGREAAEARLVASALKGGLYTALRGAFNAADSGSAERAALFWFVRDFCYGGMFRSSRSGGCNVPYGGMSYDARDAGTRLRQLASAPVAARLAATEFRFGDFEDFLADARPGEGDFVFLDPPYDSPFNAYDGAAFGRPDHLRLAAAIAPMAARWMIVISETDFIRETYCSLPGARVHRFRKSYQGQIKGRYDRGATHLMVTNYDWGSEAAP